MTEGEETVLVTLDANLGYTLADPSSATVTIADNEPEITITATDASAAETVAPATANDGQFTVSRTGDTSSALTVRSEERRAGNEGRSRWSPYHYDKNDIGS